MITLEGDDFFTAYSTVLRARREAARALQKARYGTDPADLLGRDDAPLYQEEVVLYDALIAKFVAAGAAPLEEKHLG
jgi:hypothetical protein